jgi:hypothetical protein
MTIIVAIGGRTSASAGALNLTGLRSLDVADRRFGAIYLKL